MWSRRNLSLLALLPAGIVVATWLLVAFARKNDHERTMPASPITWQTTPISKLGDEPSSVRKPLTVESSLPGPKGSLLVLDIDSRSVPSGTIWRLRRTPEGPERVVTLKDAPVELQPGVWTITPISAKWKTTTSHVEIAQSIGTTLWVGRESTLEVHVRSVGGGAIEGAYVRWAPASADDLDDTTQAITDTSGEALLLLPYGSVGTLTVAAEGYIPIVQTIHKETSRRDVTLFFEGGADHASLVTIIDADTGTGIEGATVIARDIPWWVTSDVYGQITVPHGLPRNYDLVFRAEGYCPTQLTAGEATDLQQIGLFDAAVQSFHVLDDQGTETAADVLLELASPLAKGFPRPDFPLTHLAGEPVLLPASLTMVAHAFDMAGRRGTRAFEAGSVPRPITLLIADGEVLRITLVGEGGVDIAGGQAEVWYDSWRRSFEAKDSLLVVPIPDKAVAIYLKAPGYATIRLHPHPEERRARSGEFAIRMKKGYSLRAQVIDTEGLPVPGLAVRAWPNADLVRFQMNPELNGGWPTDHAGWVEHPQRALPQITDHEGTCILGGLRPGDYTVRVTLPNIVNPKLQSLIQRIEEVVIVPIIKELTMTSPLLRYVRVIAYDARNGLPVRDVVVRSKEGEVRALSLQSGNYWEGMVALTAHESLIVMATGYAPYELQLEEGIVEREVFLEPAMPMLVEIGGSIPEGLGEVEIGVLRKVRDELGMGLYNEQVWAGRVQLVANTIPLSLPFTEQFIVKLFPFTTAQGEWTFEPSLFFLQPGKAIDVSLTLDPFSR